MKERDTKPFDRILLVPVFISVVPWWVRHYFFLRFSSTGALAFLRSVCSHQFW
jgi:hypothetical protein